MKPKLLWDLWLTLLLVRYRYVRWYQWRYAYGWAKEDCWQDYRTEGESPYRAILEDRSYG